MSPTFHYLIMSEHSMFQKELLNRLKDSGLTIGQPKVLDYLKDHDGAGQKDIARGCHIEPGTLTTLLNRMEDTGLVERRMLNGNRRSLYVSLTPKGERLGQQMEEVFSHADRAVLEVLSQDEVRQLSSLLEKLCTARQNGKEEGI